MKQYRFFFFFFGLLVLTGLISCNKKEGPGAVSNWQGSGIVVFTDYEPFASKAMRVFYYVPQAVHPDMTIVFVLHGAERNAMEYRNALVNKAEEKGFILVVPEFSEVNFPDVNGYQIGNIYQNGDAPSAATLNPEEQWALSVIEPLFSYVKVQTKSSRTTYEMIGHSGGAQFVHRFLLVKPQARVNKIVVSAAGWYTATENEVNFPYGFKNSLLATSNVNAVFAKKVFVQVGTSDNSATTTSIRRDSLANRQGAHRLARAQFFYQKAASSAATASVPFQWELKLISGLGHDFEDALPHSADLLFP